MNARLLLLAGGLLASPGVGCGGIGGEPDAAVIQVGEREFTHAQLDRFVSSRTSLGGSPDPGLLSALLDEFVREQLLLIAADEAGVVVAETEIAAEVAALNQRPGTEALVETDGEGGSARAETPPGEDEDSRAARLRAEVESRLRVDRLLQTVVLDGVEVSAEAALLEFETSRPFYARPATVTLSERRFDDRESAEAAVAAAAEGDSGAEGAGSHGFRGIGTFREGELPEAIDRAVLSLDPGETTGVVETAAGYRVFRVEERLPPGPLGFEEVEDVVRLTVLRREADARLEAFVADLETRHPVTIHLDRLRFPYLGLLSE